MMTGSALLRAIVLACLALSIASNVVDLTAETFYGFVKQSGLVLVYFYAPWCGHCSEVSQAFKEVSLKLSDESSKTILGRLDCSDPQVEEIVAGEKIDGYPTIMVYKRGERIGEYHGNRTESDILQYIARKSQSSVKMIEDELELVPFIAALDRTDQFQQGILSVVVGLFPDDVSQHEHAFGLLESVADKCDHARFFATSNAALINDFKDVQGPSLAVFSADNRDVYHTIALSTYTQEEHVLDELYLLSMPLSIPMNSEMMHILSSVPVMHALTFYDANGDDDNFLDAVLSVMPKFKGRVLMVEISSDDYHLLHHFGIESTSDLPQLIVVDPSADGHGRKFSFADYLLRFHSQQLSEGEEYEHIEHHVLRGRVTDVEYAMWIRPISKVDDNDRLFFNTTLIERYLETFLEDASAQSLQSQELEEIAKLNELSPSPNLENLASSQFDTRIMLDTTSDSFVYFHAPWCIHCKAMEAMMLELALHYRDDPHITFFRMDAQKNELAHRSVKLVGLPSMYLFPAEDKMNPVFFDGERRLQDLVDFIDLHRHGKVDAGGTVPPVAAGASAVGEHAVDVSGN